MAAPCAVKSATQSTLQAASNTALNLSECEGLERNNCDRDRDFVEQTISCAVQRLDRSLLKRAVPIFSMWQFLKICAPPQTGECPRLPKRNETCRRCLYDG